MDPKVTIMIPTYKQEPVILRAVDSALDQDYGNLEVIVSDDCSPDETRSVVARRRDPRLIYQRNPANLGRVRNYRNTLYNLASGEWVVNLDGDDYYTDRFFIAFAVNAIREAGPGLPIMFYQGKNQHQGEVKGLTYATRCATQIQDGICFVLHGAIHRPFSHMTTIYNRAAAMETDFYRKDILSTDMESLLRLALRGRVILSERVSGIWQHHKGNASRSACATERLANMEFVYSVGKSLKDAGVDEDSKREWELLWERDAYALLLWGLAKDSGIREFSAALQLLLRNKGTKYMFQLARAGATRGAELARRRAFRVPA